MIWMIHNRSGTVRIREWCYSLFYSPVTLWYDAHGAVDIQDHVDVWQLQEENSDETLRCLYL